MREFTGIDGMRVALDVNSIEAIVERETGGCTIVTRGDTYRVKDSYDEVGEVKKAEKPPKQRKKK